MTKDFDFNLALSDLEKKLLSADFEGALVIVQDEVHVHLREDAVRMTPELESLRMRAMAAEVLDYFGRYVEARAVIEKDGQRCQRVLEDLRDCRVRGPQTDAQRKMLKQRCWVVIHWGYIFYRAGELAGARDRFLLCRTIAESHLTTAGYPASGTLARIYYCLGLVAREQYDYRSAKEHFTQSMAHAWQALAGVASGRRRPQRSLSSQAALTDFNIAKCLALGLAWVHYTEGELQLAIPLLLAARTLLSKSREEIIKGYVNVVYACVLRSARGDDPDLLEEAITLLREARSVFVTKKHDYYRVRAAYHLALAYLQKARNGGPAREQALEEAMSFVSEIKGYGHRADDRLFLCNAAVIESRIDRHRGNFLRALDRAREAFELGREHPFGLVDAYIARGEARFATGDSAGAEDDFEAALQAGGDNPKVRAVCLLQLARAYTQGKDVKRAAQYFEGWKTVRGRVENVFMRHLEPIVERAMHDLTEDFIVRWSSPQLDQRKLSELRSFLVKWAKARSSSDEAAARLVGVSKQTYYNWKNAPAKTGKKRHS
jgi:hypothetical protein